MPGGTMSRRTCGNSLPPDRNISNCPSPGLPAGKTTGTYLDFLAQCGKMKKPNRRFRLVKMPGEVPFGQMDKSSISAASLVIEFLLALVDRDYGRCMDSQALLAQYRGNCWNRRAAAAIFSKCSNKSRWLPSTEKK